MRYFLTAIILFARVVTSHSQGQANHWLFGYNAHLDFNSSPPAFTGSNSQPLLAQFEGSATISDSVGNLLFYTDGALVWNRNHTQMPNGYELMGHWSSTNSGLVVPKPGNPDQFYIFTAHHGGYFYMEPSQGLHYNLVSLCHNQGLGDVIPEQKNKPLYKPSSERIAATHHSNGTDVWVVTHDFEDNFFVYLVTEAGVQLHHQQQTGKNQMGEAMPDNTIGQMKISPDGSLLALALYGTGEIEVYPFDKNTGLLGERKISFRLSDPYGVEFSPDNSKLYVTWYNGRWFDQFDLSYTEPFDIYLNSFRLFSDYQFGRYLNDQLQLGPDGKIYTSILLRINNPNLPGELSEVDSSRIDLVDYRDYNPIRGVSSFISSYLDISPKIEYAYTCFGDSVAFRLIHNESVKSVEWNFGDEPTPDNFSTQHFPKHLYSKTGIYSASARITLQNGEILTKQKKVIMKDFTLDIGKDSVLCDTNECALDATQNEVACYQWHDGSEAPVYQASQTGWHWVHVRNSGCTKVDSVYLEFLETPSVNLGTDKILCEGDSLKLIAQLPDANWRWDDGSEQAEKIIRDAGIYWLEVYRNRCTFRDSVKISIQPYPERMLPSDTTLCDSEPVQVSVEQLANTYNWSDGSTLATRTLAEQGQYWVDIEKNKCVTRDSILVSDITIPAVFTIDTLICTGTIIRLGVEQPETDYQWSTGESKAFIQVGEKGMYAVALSNRCYETEINYHIETEDCPCDIFVPNVVTANGDGKNDYFQIIAHQRVKDFRLRIVNRWGSEIFTAANVEGKWEHMDVPEGVYYWELEYTCLQEIDEIRISRKGWVHLIR
jgi:gliding motility-associated-like protein